MWLFWLACQGQGVDSVPPDDVVDHVPVGIDLVPQRWELTQTTTTTMLDRWEAGGADFAHVYGLAWIDAEQSPGAFTFDLEPMLAELRQRKVPCTLDMPSPVQVGTSGGVPSWVQGSFGDPSFDDAYMAFVRAQMQAFNGIEVTHVVLHTETASTTLPLEERDAYCAMLTSTATMLREEFGVRVGTYAVEYDDDAFIECINRGTDFLGMSLVFEGDEGSPADALVAQMERIAGVAPELPIGIIEAAWPSAATLGSSDAHQQQFVDALFDLADDNRIEFGAFYTLFDEDEALAESYIQAFFPDWPDELVQAYVAWVGSLGLQTIDAEPKPAWDRFVERAAR